MKILATIALLLTSLAVHAEESPTFVTSYASLPGESLDAFALRIAPDTIDRSMSVKIAAEVCGEFYKTGDVYAIDIYTIRRIGQCSYNRTPAKGEYTGLSFHTHVFIESYATAAAKLSNPRFSDEDYAHPGYLASGRKVLFQNGIGTERRVRSAQ